MPLESMVRRRKRRPVRLVVGGGPLPAKPAAPTITIPVDGAVMNDNTPTVSGTGEPGLTVMVSTATQSVGTATVQEDGTWTLTRSEEHTSELQSRENLVCRLLLEKKKSMNKILRNDN